MAIKGKEKIVHLGQNIRRIRLIRGMKQSTFAQELGIAQQNVSKMENKINISEEQLELVAQILNTSVEAIKKFNENAVINNNILYNDQINNPVTEIITYFSSELAKKDEELEKLRKEIEILKYGDSTKPSDIGSTEGEKKMKAL